jgi:competence protein ComEC
VGGIVLGAAFVAGLAVGLPGVVAIALAGVALRFAGRASLTWLVVVVTVSMAGMLRATQAPVPSSPVWTADASAVRGVVVSGPISSKMGQRFDAAIEEVRIGSVWQSAHGIACVSASDLPELRRGDRLFLVVASERMEDLPSGLAHALSARGCAGSLTAWRTTKVSTGSGILHAVDGVRRSMANRLQGAAPGDEGSLLAGLVTGEDGALSDEARNAFVATGTTHITAVSGSNIALVVVFALAVGGRIGLHRRLFWQAITAGGVWFYALLVGLEPPAFRAALVATGAVFAISFGRRADLVTLTVLAAAIQLLCRPSDYWTLSFRLSFVSALALALVLREMSGSGVLRMLASGLVATTAAQIATTPVLISTFGQVSPLSLPTNLVITPFVEIAFPIAVAAGLVGFASGTCGDAVAAVGGVCAGSILRLVNAMSEIQGAQLTVATPGIVGNAIAGAASIATIALLSADCRRAVRRARSWLSTTDGTKLVLAGIGCLGFVIGLSVGATR